MRQTENCVVRKREKSQVPCARRGGIDIKSFQAREVAAPRATQFADHALSLYISQHTHTRDACRRTAQFADHVLSLYTHPAHTHKRRRGRQARRQHTQVACAGPHGHLTRRRHKRRLHPASASHRDSVVTWQHTARRHSIDRHRHETTTPGTVVVRARRKSDTCTASCLPASGQ